MNNQYLYNGYNDYGLKYSYPNYREGEGTATDGNGYENGNGNGTTTTPPPAGGLREARIEGGRFALTNAEVQAGVSDTAPRAVEPGGTVSVIATTGNPAYSFSHWTSDVPGTQFMPNETSQHALFLMPNSNINVVAVNDPIFKVGDRVRINADAQNWANGEAIPAGARGIVDTVREIRAEGTEILLNVLGKWIRISNVERIEHSNEDTAVAPEHTLEYHDVQVINGRGSGRYREGTRIEITAAPTTGERFVNWTVVSGGVEIAAPNQASTYFFLSNQNAIVRANFEDGPSGTTPPGAGGDIRVGDRVIVNQGVRTWATGEGMPSWVNGRTYPVIEIRVRNGATQLLLGDGINSWIRKTDVARTGTGGGSTTPPAAPIRINDRVRVNQGVRTWATGEGMPSWVHGRIYPVIEIRTRNGETQLLLGEGINSWIRQTDVARA